MRCNIFSTCLTALCLLFAVQACAAASATSSASVTVGDGSVVVSAPIKSDIVLPYDLKYWVGIGGSYPIEGITQGLAATLTMPNASTTSASLVRRAYAMSTLVRGCAMTTSRRQFR